MILAVRGSRFATGIADMKEKMMRENSYSAIVVTSESGSRAMIPSVRLYPYLFNPSPEQATWSGYQRLIG